MALCLPTRKRTNSFSSPRPAKQQRTDNMGLRRTESYLLVTDHHPSTAATITFTTLAAPPKPAVPYKSSLQFYKDQRQAQKKAIQQTWPCPPPTVSLRPSPTPTPPIPAKPTTATPKHPLLQPAPVPKPAKQPTSPRRQPPPPKPSERLTSPLAPTRKPLPSRPSFPRSKPDIDLYKKAIVTCMRSTPAGQQILRMGARNAVSVMSATRELERMVKEREGESDVVMADAAKEEEKNTPPAMSQSWVVLKDSDSPAAPATAQAEDWEMLDCTSN